MNLYRIERLDRHDRSQFDCGNAELSGYLRERATQDMRRRLSTCFVALDEKDVVAGFYTIAATSVPIDRLPAERASRLPRYPVVPAVLLGRLAVSRLHQGKGLGAALVVDALGRAASSEVMAHAMIVESKNEDAARFYAHLGFERLGDDRRKLIRAL